MSYAIGNVIYGFALDHDNDHGILTYLDELRLSERRKLCHEGNVPEERIEELIYKESEDLLEALGYQMLYCSSGCPVGYFGVELCRVNETATVDVMKDLILHPTSEQIAEVHTRLEKFPHELKRFVDPCKVYIVWSSS